MKQWLCDGLIGWAAGFLTLVLYVLIIMPAFIFAIASMALWSLFTGFLGGFLGGRFLKFKWSNAVGGAVLSIILAILLFRL